MTEVLYIVRHYDFLYESLRLFQVLFNTIAFVCSKE